MTLQAGTSLGTYEIVAPLGAGGMGEVYRARDRTLRREVAIKTLREAMARDPDRLSRSEREARVLASLNHPNIAAIYGFEEHEGTRFLVLELVEGPTLADRIARGPVPVDEAVRIATQIAVALEAAHEQGIVHRDLKPANVKVRPDGTVKVLDFGLAKALEPPGGISSDEWQAATHTAPTATHAGMVLGTPAYMSPEQASGKPVDRRADVWAFGVVLLEMLTGERVFKGDPSQILSDVLQREPDWKALPKRLPPGLAALLRRCLAKDPRQRVRDIGDMRLALEGAFEVAGGQATRSPIPQPFWRRALPAAASAVVAGSVVSALFLRGGPEGRAMTRLTITPPTAAPLRIDGGDRDLVVTPDGSRVVYAASAGGATQLFVRPLGAFEPTALGKPITTRANGGGAQGLSISPDGQWVSYVENNFELKKVAIGGGPVIPLVTMDEISRGVTWAGPDRIVFATVRPERGLQSVSAEGGDVTVLTVPDVERGETNHLWPEALPGGQRVLFTIVRIDPAQGAEVALLDLKSGRYRTLFRGGSHAHYLASGHLVYAAENALLAVPFDPESGAVRGTPVLIVPHLFVTSQGGADFSVSSDGTLVYVDATAPGDTEQELVWVDRRGRAVPAVERADRYVFPTLSPDGDRIAIAIRDEREGSDIWILEPKRGGARTRLTFGPGAASRPIWTPDGRRVTFASIRGSVGDIRWKPADGSGAEEALTDLASPNAPSSWSPDGSTLAFHREGDLFLMRRGDPPTRLQATPFFERYAVFSPDGHWLAYTSNETGRDEVYVRPYAGPGARIPISNDGGRWPHWSASGEELFYIDGDRMMAVTIHTGSTLRPEVPRLLFTRPGAGADGDYDVAPDGRFLMLQPVNAARAEPEPPRIQVVLGWFEELRRLAPRD